MLKPMMCLHHMHKSCRHSVMTDICFVGLGLLRVDLLLEALPVILT